MSRLNFKIKRYAAAAVMALVFIMCCAPFAQAEDFDDESSFETTNYNVTLNVLKNAEINIAERISVDISEPIHGIYRYIPFSRTVDYTADGSKVHQRYAAMKISDVSVSNDPFEVFRKRGNEVIKIGSGNKTVKGKKKYDLSYRVTLYEDTEDKYDTFYYNVLPFDWSTAVQSSKITLVMPKKFHKEDVSVMAGKDGDPSMNSRIKWKKKNNTITIETLKTLPKGYGITVGIKLPEGYFEDAATHTLFHVLMYILAVLSIAAMLALWFRFGRDPKNIQTVEFYPPEGVTSAEVGYIIDGHVDKEDVISLLFYFAQSGLIDITEEGKNNYVITRLADLPPTAKQYERVFYNGLFETGDTVRFSDLQDTFYDTFSATKEMVESEFGRRGNKLFHGTANIIRMALVALPPVAAAIFGWMIWRTYGSILLLAASVLIVLLTPVSYIIGIYVQDKTHVLKKTKKILLSLISLGLVLLSMLMTIWICISVMGNWIMALLFAAVLAIGYFTSRFMRSRTKKGAELLGKILGFKEFIRIAEKDRLEKLIEENPDYFYDVLPYAYVMGLSKKWAKKFEGIAVESPVWYRGGYSSTSFNTWMFYGMFNDLTRYAGATMRVPAANDSTRFSGGDFGGGGFSSGGGFGGGGGGAW